MIGYAVDVFIIILLFALFGYTHSLFASNKIKRLAVSYVGNYIAFYRIVYNITSVLAVYLLYIILPRPHIIIYDLNYPYDFIILIPQYLSLAGFIWSLRFICVKEFLGISQIRRWFNNQYDINELDEELSLRIRGTYKYIRHPLYFFSIMFLLFRPVMDLFYLTCLICIMIYFYMGSHYEEKKLVEKFGGDYIRYREVVPRFFPLKIFTPYNEPNN
jgi:protein-S-isoprenylcysteine O-methyltransferase Ste14